VKKSVEDVARYADMFAAMGTESRLRIMQLLLSAHPEGMVVGEIQAELDRREPRGNVPAVPGEHVGVAGFARISVRRVLYAQSGG
jgi:hypothetical protein